MVSERTVRNTLNRTAFGVGAISLWILGLSIICQGGYYSSRFSYYFDFGEYHLPVGVLFLGFGACFAYFAIRRTRDPS